MNKFHTYSIVTTFGLLGAALAYGQQPQTMPPQGQQPSTSETEGTAADRTAPGHTPTQGAQSQMDNQMENQMEHPRPATSPTEGTAADTSPPGKTPTMQQGQMVGATVVSQTDTPLGKVVDVVFDAKNQPAFVVIASEGESVAVPYSVANSMRNDEDKIVMDQARLHSAPKVKRGEWRQSSGTWKNDATRYWERRGG